MKNVCTACACVVLLFLAYTNADESSFLPQRVGVGVYVMNLGAVSTEEGKFQIDFYLFFVTRYTIV